MHTVSEIVDAFGYSKLAEKLGIPPGTVSAWKSPARNSIPGEYWSAIVRAADAEGKPGITLEALASAHARPIPSEEGAA